MLIYNFQRMENKSKLIRKNKIINAYTERVYNIIVLNLWLLMKTVHNIPT